MLEFARVDSHKSSNLRRYCTRHFAVSCVPRIGPRIALPGKASRINWPSRITNWPFTTRYRTPSDGWRGFSYVARSIIVVGSKTTNVGEGPFLDAPYVLCIRDGFLDNTRRD